MGYILGIDQGGTKTAAIVTDYEGNVLGWGLADGASYADTGMDHAMLMVKNACGSAFLKAGIGIEQVETVSAGLTGADWPEEYVLLQDALRSTTGMDDVKVYNDCIIAMRGGTDKPFGAVICAGSGLNVGIASPDGKIDVLGYYIDANYQGAAAVGNRAIRAVIASETGMAQATALTEIVLNYFDLKTVEEIVRKFVSGQLPKDTKKLAPRVIDAAEAGDAAAAEIVEDFGRGAAKYAAAGLKRYNMLNMDVDVILSGSMFKNMSRLLMASIASVFLETCPNAHLVDAVYEPVVGAALLALDRRYNGKPNGIITKNIHTSCVKFGLLRM